MRPATRVIALLFCSLCAALAHAHTLEAQLGAQLSARDSLRYLNAARKAQAAFERYRYDHLPRSVPTDAKPCDEKIGRFCYWHSADDSTVAEPPAITKAREQLLRTLDALSQLSRADDWIVGQKLRYLVEAGYDSSAIVAARACWSAAWWCGVLRGFALHAAQRYEASEAAFDSALTRMPAEERCRWTDVSVLLTDDDRKVYSTYPCGSAARDEFEARFWRLADPSYVIPGNDRRTEHFSRVLLATLYATSQNAYEIPWGDDLRELMIRYGTPLSYSTTWTPSMFTTAPTPLIGHEREPSYHFAALDATTDVARWDVRAENARERYSPSYLDSLVDLDAQFGMFQRGDSALIVAVYNDSSRADSADSKTAIGVSDASAVTVSTDVDTRSDTLHEKESLHTPRIRVTRAAWKGVVVGVEQYDPRHKCARRARRWLAPPISSAGKPGLSTLLFYDGTDTSAVVSLQDAIHRAVTTNVVPPTRKLGMYWEVYAPSDTTAADSSAADTSTTDVSLTVTRIDGGIMKWLAQTLRISPKDSPLAIGWHDVPGASGISYRSVVLDLAQLPKGAYRVALDVGGTTTTRDIQIR